MSNYEGIPIYCADPVDAFGVVTESRHKPASNPGDNPETLLFGFWLTEGGLGIKPGTGFCHLALGRDVIKTTWAEVRERLQRGLNNQ